MHTSEKLSTELTEITEITRDIMEKKHQEYPSVTPSCGKNLYTMPHILLYLTILGNNLF